MTRLFRTVSPAPSGGPDIVSDWMIWDGTYHDPRSINRSNAEGVTMYMPGSELPPIQGMPTDEEEPLENE